MGGGGELTDTRYLLAGFTTTVMGASDGGEFSSNPKSKLKAARSCCMGRGTETSRFSVAAMNLRLSFEIRTLLAAPCTPESNTKVLLVDEETFGALAFVQRLRSCCFLRACEGELGDMCTCVCIKSVLKILGTVGRY